MGFEGSPQSSLRPGNKKGIQNWIWKVIVEQKEINDHKETFYEFLNSLSTKTFTNEQFNLCKNKIWETDLLDSIKTVKSNKTSGMNWKLLSWKVLIALSILRAYLFHKEKLL